MNPGCFAFTLFIVFLATSSAPGQVPLGLEFQVNSYTTNGQGGADIAMDDDGDFAVVWDSPEQDGSSTGVFGQRFARDASSLGIEFQVNTFTTAHQEFPSVSMDASGNFAVVWESVSHGGGVFAQHFASILAGAGKLKRGPKPKNNGAIDAHYEAIQKEMQNLFQTLKIAA